LPDAREAAWVEAKSTWANGVAIHHHAKILAPTVAAALAPAAIAVLPDDMVPV